MKSQIHHAAIKTAEFDRFVSLFGEVFGMSVEKTDGAPGARKLWFVEGIQLNECPAAPAPGGSCDHIAIAVEDIPSVLRAALDAGCTMEPDGPHWIALPDGTRIELIPL